MKHCSRLSCVSSVARYISVHEQHQYNRICYFHFQCVLLNRWPFCDSYIVRSLWPSLWRGPLWGPKKLLVIWCCIRIKAEVSHLPTIQSPPPRPTHPTLSSFILTVSRRFFCSSVAVLLCLSDCGLEYSVCSVLICFSSLLFCASKGVCFVVEAFPGFLHL